MKETTIIDIIRDWIQGQLNGLLNYLLKKNGYDFGIYYMEELEKMYQKHKDEIKRD